MQFYSEWRMVVNWKHGNLILKPWVQSYNLCYSFLRWKVGENQWPPQPPSDGELEACVISQQKLFLVSPKSPLQGSSPSTASCSVVHIGICRIRPWANRGKKKNMQNLQAPIIPSLSLGMLCCSWAAKAAGPAPPLLLDSQEQSISGVILCPWVTRPKKK